MASTHVGDRERYVEDCGMFFGRYLHHQREAGDGEETGEKLKNGFESTLRLYEEVFESNPREMEAWGYGAVCGDGCGGDGCGGDGCGGTCGGHCGGDGGDCDGGDCDDGGSFIDYGDYPGDGHYSRGAKNSHYHVRRCRIYMEVIDLYDPEKDNQPKRVMQSESARVGQEASMDMLDAEYIQCSASNNSAGILNLNHAKNAVRLKYLLFTGTFGTFGLNFNLKEITAEKYPYLRSIRFESVSVNRYKYSGIGLHNMQMIRLERLEFVNVPNYNKSPVVHVQSPLIDNLKALVLQDLGFLEFPDLSMFTCLEEITVNSTSSTKSGLTSLPVKCAVPLLSMKLLDISHNRLLCLPSWVWMLKMNGCKVEYSHNPLTHKHMKHTEAMPRLEEPKESWTWTCFCCGKAEAMKEQSLIFIDSVPYTMSCCEKCEHEGYKEKEGEGMFGHFVDKMKYNSAVRRGGLRVMSEEEARDKGVKVLELLKEECRRQLDKQKKPAQTWDNEQPDEQLMSLLEAEEIDLDTHKVMCLSPWQLQRVASERGVDITQYGTKAEIVKALRGETEEMVGKRTADEISEILHKEKPPKNDFHEEVELYRKLKKEMGEEEFEAHLANKK